MNNCKPCPSLLPFPIGIVILLIIASFIKDAKQYLSSDHKGDTEP